MINKKINIYNSIINDNNKKQIFEITSKNTLNTSSSFNTINNKNLEFFSLKKEFQANNLCIKEYYRYNPQSNIKSNSSKKSIKNNFNAIEDGMSEENNLKENDYTQNNKEDILGNNKRRKDKNIEDENIFISNSHQKKGKSDINLIINDNFFDLLVDVYKKEEIEIGFKEENEKSIKNAKNKKVNNNINHNIKEQISCICLKSRCLNNYCSCHKNGNKCNKNCRCLDCKNNDNI